MTDQDRLEIAAEGVNRLRESLGLKPKPRRIGKSPARLDREAYDARIAELHRQAEIINSRRTSDDAVERYQDPEQAS